MLKSTFIITARLKSKRLPKKLMLEISGEPLIVHMINRIKQSETVDRIVICTSKNTQDDPLEELSEREKIYCYRGSEDDVLQRLYEASIIYGSEYFLNITADCPLVDPFFIDKLVDEYKKRDADFIKYSTLPAGQRPYLIKIAALKKVCDIKNEIETEVWENYFIESGIFNVYECPVDNKFINPKLKTSIDYIDDYVFIKEVFKKLYHNKRCFSLLDIINLVEKNNNLLNINSHCLNLSKIHITKTSKGVDFKKNYNYL